MNKENPKKRKRNILDDLNISVEQKLKIKPVDYIECCICHLPVYNFREIHCNDITCSYECESILFLSKQNRLLHEKDEVISFESAMIRSPTRSTLDEDEYNINEDEEDEHMSTDSSHNYADEYHNELV